jgi:NAD-dependent deacetylase
MSAVSDAARMIFEQAERGLPIVAFTGAGISQESGVPTFRGGGGIWERYAPEQVATVAGFFRNPAVSWSFHEELRRTCLRGRPNPAHIALAWMENSLRSTTTCPVITQNIDGFHQAAGSSEVTELHGSCHRVRCVECSFADEDLPAEFPELPPVCACGELLRPDVVWFGEQLPPDSFEHARTLAERAGVMIVIGTSATVQPAASIPFAALQGDVPLVEINPVRTALSELVNISIRGLAGTVLPELAEEVGQQLNGPDDTEHIRE